MSRTVNSYTPETIPQVATQEQILPPKPLADTQVVANPAHVPQPQADGITSEKYEAALAETMDVGIKTGKAQFIKITAGAAFLTGIVKSFLMSISKDPYSWNKVGKYAAIGGGVGLGLLTLSSFLGGKSRLDQTTELGQSIAQHESQAGATPQTPAKGGLQQYMPSPEELAQLEGMQNYRPTPEEMAQLQAMQQQAMQEMQMLANMKLDADAHPVVKQLQGFAQTMVSGRELSPVQQQEAAALMQQIQQSPQLQHEIEMSMKKPPVEKGTGPDTVEKTANHKAPSPKEVTPDTVERMQLAASREVS